jgi:hypothetical protein
MGFLTTTWVTCQKCGEVFGCGCVITNVCQNCERKACTHDFLEPDRGVRICRLCFGIEDPSAPGAVKETKKRSESR